MDKSRANATLALGARARPHRDPRRLRWFDRDGGNDLSLDPDPNSYGEFDPDRYEYLSLSFDYSDDVDE